MGTSLGLCALGWRRVVTVLGASWFLRGMLNIYEMVFIGTLLHPLSHADGKVFFEKAAEICLKILKHLGLWQEETGGVWAQMSWEQNCAEGVVSPLPLPVYPIEHRCRGLHQSLECVSWAGPQALGPVMWWGAGAHWQERGILSSRFCRHWPFIHSFVDNLQQMSSLPQLSFPSRCISGYLVICG